MAFIDTFAKYHTLSKYPVDENTSLANVRNKSGHTVTTGDIWSSEIPAFFVVYDDDTRNSLAAQEGDLCTQGSQLYEYKDGAWATRSPLTDGEIIGGVIKYHKGCKAVILTDTNNSGTGGNGYSVRIRPNGSAATDPFIESFISSMDKVVNGIPSMGYNPVVHDTTSATGFRDEGTGTNEFIANCYGGVITFNTKRTDAESKITIDCFEYIGERLNSTIDNLSETIKDIVDVSLGQVVANIDTTTAASNAGISIIDTEETGAGSKTSPVIDIETAELKDGVFDEDDTRLVNAKDVSSFIINKVNESSIKTITINDNGGQLKETYDADENNNISLGDGIQKVYNINRLYPDVKDTNRNMGSYADDYDPSVSGEKIWDDLGAINYIRKYFYDLDKAEFGYGPDEIYDAEQKGNKIVVNGKPIGIEDTISYKNMQGGLTIRYYRRLGSHDANGYWTDIVYRGVKGREGINEINWTWKPEGTGWRAAQWDGFCYPKQKWDNVVYDADLEDMTVEKTASGITVKQDTGYLDSITVTSATYTPATESTEGSWENLDNVITGTNVKNAIDEVHSKINALHETPQFTVRFVSGVTDLKNWKDAVEEGIKKNTIYLVQNPEAQDGSCVEYIAYESGNSIVTEKIGTTKTDLSGYVNKIATGQATTLANKGSVYANIATDGTLTLGVASASADGKGLVQLAANVADGSTTDVTTAKAVKDYAQKALTVKDGRETVTENDVWGTTATLDSDGVLTIEHKWLTRKDFPNLLATFNSPITKVIDNKVYRDGAFYCNVQTDRMTNMDSSGSGSNIFGYSENVVEFHSDLSNLTHGYGLFSDIGIKSFNVDMPSLKEGQYMFYGCGNLESFSSDLSKLTDGTYMFKECTRLESFSSDLPNLTDSNYMFSGCTALTSFTSDLSSLTDGSYMFNYAENLSQFDTDLPKLAKAQYMFIGCIELESFSTDLSSLTDGFYMFYDCTALTAFTSDLSSLTDGDAMFYNCTALTSFTSDLSSLTDGHGMFWGCKLDTESVEIIADTINTVTSRSINIGIGNDTPNDEEDAAFKQMQDKGWDVYVNGSDTEYVPRTGEASLDETGETPVAPKPYWAKPIEVTEDKAEYVGQDGKFYQVVGGQFIYVNDPDTYGMFVSLEDAVANMRLTKYVKPVEEETEAQA